MRNWIVILYIYIIATKTKYINGLNAASCMYNDPSFQH